MRKILKRLRPYGSVRPSGLSAAHLRAYVLGFRDGFNQPHDLSSSTNVEHLLGDEGEAVQESLDAGINLGQWVRSPYFHQQQGTD
jgi:hypothetical protein